MLDESDGRRSNHDGVCASLHAELWKLKENLQIDDCDVINDVVPLESIVQVGETRGEGGGSGMWGGGERRGEEGRGVKRGKGKAE